jgi:PAS domain S-box-containing protein
MREKDQQIHASINPLTSASNPLQNSAGAGRQGMSPLYNLAITIAGIFLAEVITMMVLPLLGPIHYFWLALVDALVMVVIVFPVLYFLSFRPLLLQIQQRNQANKILQARLHLIQFATTHSLDELLQITLDEVESLTGSTIGFFHFLEADERTLWLQAWSTKTLQNMCQAEGKGLHYDIDQAGVWADAVRERKPTIHNNYASLPQRKGTPEGHALVVREMVVPVLRADKVVAIIGVGNKPQDFNSNDAEIVSTLADFAWDIVVHKQAENAIHRSEEKFRTLVEWTYDWELWVDPDGKIIYTSPSCERITGYTPEEFMTDPDLLVSIIHLDDQKFYSEHLKVTHDASIGPIKIEYRIISRDGSEHWIEHICRPLFNQDNQYLGRRVSNRDITERKRTEQKIIQQTQREAKLTETIRTIQTDMARDLHDTLGQNISYLRIKLAHLLESPGTEPAQITPQIQNMAKVADESYDLVREMLAILQSDYSANPLSLFTRYAERVAERSTIRIGITSQGDPYQLSPYQIRQLFYIFREALSNIEKYARANRVSGDFIWGDQTLTMVITDDGVGFDQDANQTTGHYGLKFMRERAELLKASFSIHSAPSNGTRITVVMPYEASVQAQ